MSRCQELFSLVSFSLMSAMLKVIFLCRVVGSSLVREGGCSVMIHPNANYAPALKICETNWKDLLVAEFRPDTAGFIAEAESKEPRKCDMLSGLANTRVSRKFAE